MKRARKSSSVRAAGAQINEEENEIGTGGGPVARDGDGEGKSRVGVLDGVERGYRERAQR